MFQRTSLYIILALLCLLVYGNSLGNGFISDDIPAILENPQISQASRYWLKPSEFFNSLCFIFFGSNPLPYHLVSILLHCLNTLLVFCLLRLYFATAPSFWGACIFAVHPAHTEAVTWISGRPYLVLAFFILSVYLLYQRALNFLARGRKSGIIYYFLSLALFSYYIATSYSFFALLPLFLVLSDLTLKQWRRNGKFWLLFLVILAFRLILARSVIAGRIIEVSNDLGAALVHNPLIYLVYVFYSHLRILIWPLRLTFYYDPAILRPALTNYSFFYFLPIAVALWLSFKRQRRIFFALGSFILFLSPAYSPIPITSLVAERYLYFPSLALSIVIAVLYERYIRENRKIKLVCLPILLALVVLLGIRTLIRNRDWKNEAIFWRKTLLSSPKSSRAHNNMGLLYLKGGQIPAAKEEFICAIALKPDNLDAYGNLSIAYQRLGKTQEAAAILKKAIELKPQYAFSYYHLANLLAQAGNTEEAISLYQQALRINPHLIKAYNNLGNLYLKAGRAQEAIFLFRQAISLSPDYAPAYLNLAIAYFAKEDFFQAIKYCDSARRLGLEIPSGFLNSLQPYRKKK